MHTSTFVRLGTISCEKQGRLLKYWVYLKSTKCSLIFKVLVHKNAVKQNDITLHSLH